jgi:hypothetical protein
MRRQALRNRAWKKAQRQKARREEPWKHTSDNHAITLKVIRDLYTAQINHWNAKLQGICQLNNHLHAHASIDAVDENADRQYIRRNRHKPGMFAGIALTPKVHLHWQLSKLKSEEGFYYLPIHEDLEDKFVKELKVIHGMLEELYTERDVIRKFLSFAMGFGVTWDYFAQSLDSDILSDYFNESRVDQPALDLNDPAVINRLNQFDEYIEENRTIVETMANRQLENLLLGDIL